MVWCIKVWSHILTVQIECGFFVCVCSFHSFKLEQNAPRDRVLRVVSKMTTNGSD